MELLRRRPRVFSVFTLLALVALLGAAVHAAAGQWSAAGAQAVMAVLLASLPESLCG